MSKNRGLPAGDESLRRSILPLLRRRISRARRRECVVSVPVSVSVASGEADDDHVRPGVSTNRIGLPSVSSVTSCGNAVVVGPLDEVGNE